MINYRKIARLAEYGCTEEEMAAGMGMTLEAWRMALEGDKMAQEAIEQGRGMGRMKLRRKQYRVALQGEVGMLSHLGKHMLGQIDKTVAVTATASIGDVLEMIEARRAAGSVGAEVAGLLNDSSTKK